jgi:hypothetical protein
MLFFQQCVWSYFGCITHKFGLGVFAVSVLCEQLYYFTVVTFLTKKCEKDLGMKIIGKEYDATGIQK